MTITLGYSTTSAPSALRIAEASGGRIIARHGPGDINWGRRRSTSARLNVDITAACNKRRARELFDEYGVPSPAVYDAQEAYSIVTRETPNEALHGMVLIGRPDFHTRGRGFWRVETLDDLNRAVAGTRRKQPATHFMQFVDAPKEFRVHVFKGKSIRISQKAFNEDRSDYTTARPEEGSPRKRLRKAAREAVAAVGLDFGAVDLLASEDQRRCWVLEVNAAPGLGGSMPRLYADTFINHFEEVT